MKEYSILEIQKLMESGKLSARNLTEMYLDRIKEIDENDPKLNSIIEINPEALVIAEKLDEERKQGKIRGQLHGIPIIIKDNIGTADKMQTTAGSLAFEGNISPKDAFIIELLRKEGAIILAKANLSEWANFRSTRSTSGWSSRGGQTKNPYILNRSPCGSSSGSAVAVAANLCSVAIGTETDGSIVCPAHANSIVGIKPTIGLVSRSGIVPISHSQDTAGPMARSVEDAVILLNGMIGRDPEDKTTQNDYTKKKIDYTKYLDVNGLMGARIGIARNYFGRNNLVDEIMEQAIQVMKEQGAEIIDPANIETLNELREPEYTILLMDFKHDMNDYLKKFGKNLPFKSFKEIIEYNEENKEKIMQYFGQEHFIRAEEKGPITSDEYKDALKKCLEFSREKGIDKILKEHNLDAIMAPTGGPAWPIDLINGDHFTGGSSSIAAIAGYPNITIPAGYIFGLPIGISFFSGAFQEPKLIKIAYAFEEAAKIRQPPEFIENFEVK